MIKQTRYFGNPANLRIKNKQLSVELFSETGTTYHSLPVDDLGIIILDHPQITISSGVIQALQANNTVIITCDHKHMPQSLTFPLEGHSIQQERYDYQLAASEPLKKNLWMQTIVQKLKNQAAVLDSFLLESNYLVPLYKNVKSGDSDNCEATAAAYYWKTLFAHIPDFTRKPEGIPPNNLLNYGYAILRATMARSIVAAGLLPTLGIFHRNRYNAFCLADDLMEPYRPYVDEIVYKFITEFGLIEDLQAEHKRILLGIPAIDVVIEGERSPLMIATQRTANSLYKCYEGNLRKLIYPEL
jgi:CRISP-associated protein Cas1